jgi:hypothetical protein
MRYSLIFYLLSSFAIKARLANIPLAPDPRDQPNQAA